LPIHLPHQQHIVFDPSSNAEHILECRENADTPLIAFFKANQLPGPIGALARTLTYQEFPNHFVIQSDVNNPQSKVWCRRQRDSFALGWIIYVGPTGGERFHLRMLLMVVKGPQSFEDLKTVDGDICGTFHDTCLRRGLLEDDGEMGDMLTRCRRDPNRIPTLTPLHHTLAFLCAYATKHALDDVSQQNM
jgi:hypothetical protein